MLARIDMRPKKATERIYSGFPWWHAMLIEPNREQKSAEWLKRFNVHAYLPTYSKVVKKRGARSGRKLCAAISGMLFIPQEMMDIPRRDEVFEYAHIRGYIRAVDGVPTRISKADIELIRLMEAKLNLPPEAKGVLFKVGQQVAFSDNLYAWSWGNGIIFEIASEHRIGIEVSHLFGRATKVYVPASEIEAI